MLTATLGGLIKDYRLKKRLSQLEVSLRIGWSDATRLSKIEQGRVGKPTRETIDKIIKALELNEQEKGEFLLTGGYLPTEEEIKLVIKIVKDKIDNWCYPAYLMDFSFRWLYTNPLTIALIKLPPEETITIEKNKPNFLEAPFLSYDQFPCIVKKGEDVDHLLPFSFSQVTAFKTENSRYQREGWYRKLIGQLMKYEEFRTLWSSVTLADYHKSLFDYEYKQMTIEDHGKKITLDFHLQTAKFIFDPRFQVVLYHPATQETSNFYQKHKKDQS